MSRIDESKEFIPVRIAVLTVSDSRDMSDDRSGDTLVARIEDAGHILADRMIVRDERDQVAEQLREWIANPEVDVVISTGGTGLTGRDVTVEAHRDGLYHRVDAKDRHLGGAEPGDGGRGGGHLSLCAAGQSGGVQGCLGRNPEISARLSAPALQFRGDHAAS